MTERAELVGGRLEVSSRPGGGTTVTAVVRPDRGNRARRHLVAGGPGWAHRCSTSSSTAAEACRWLTACQGRRSGVCGTASSTIRPAASISATASRDTSVTPRPATAPATTAPLEPSVSVAGSASSSASSAWHAARVPEPASRSSQVAPIGSDTPGGPTTTSSLRRTARTATSSDRGGRPAMTRSASWAASSPHTRSRLPTSSRRSTPGWRSRSDAISTGTMCSPAVVTAATRTRACSGSAAPRAAASPSSCRPRISRAYPAKMRPGPVSRSPRPCRSSSGTPTSRVSAASAAETADSVTMSRAAAARTDPVSVTATYARSRPEVVTSTIQQLKKSLMLSHNT